EPGVEALLKLLNDQDDGVRKTVCRVFSRTTNSRVVHSLQKAALAESNPEIQKNIVEAIEAAGPIAIPALLSLLESGNWHLVKSGSKGWTALKWRPETPKQTLLHALATGNADLAVDVAEQVPDVLTSAMRSSDKTIQSTAATVRLTLENMRVLTELSQGVSPR